MTRRIRPVDYIPETNASTTNLAIIDMDNGHILNQRIPLALRDRPCSPEQYFMAMKEIEDRWKEQGRNAQVVLKSRIPDILKKLRRKK